MKQALLVILSVLVYNVIFSQSDEKANVLAVEKNTADAFTKHNIVGLNAAFADDATIISATGEVMTKQQLLQTVQNINSASVSDLKVRVDGGSAVVTGIEIETGKDNNGIAYSNKMRFTDVFIKSKNAWIIISSQATSLE